MRSNILVPNKPVFVLQWLFFVMFLVWIFTYNKYVAIGAGSFGIVFSLYMLFKPQTLPRSIILFPDNVPDNFFNWSQRLIHFIYLILSVFILLNYRVSNSREIGLFLLVICGAMVIIDVLWLTCFAGGAPSTSRDFTLFSLIMFSCLGVGAIFMITRNFPVRISNYAPGAVGAAIGSIIGYFLHASWAIKKE